MNTKLRRILSLLLVIIMTTSLLSACGRGSDGGSDTTAKEKTTATDKADNGDDKETTSPEPKESKETSSETTEMTTSGEKGQELTDFVTLYSNSKSVLMDELTKSMESSNDFAATMAMLGFAFADLQIAFIPMFDIVDMNNGILPMMDIKNAYRKVNGGTIEFGYDYTYEEDKGNNQKGDKVVWKGVLDVKANSLKSEDTNERAGKVITRNVIEVTMKKDNSYISQMISYTTNEDQAKLNAYFTAFEGKDIRTSIGTLESPKVDFDYNSIYKNSNSSMEDMIKGFKITTQSDYINGKLKSVTNN